MPMAFITYENRWNPHVTIHVAGCSQIAKRGGEHKHGQGEYRDHATFSEAQHYAFQTGLEVVECSFCKPPGQERASCVCGPKQSLGGGSSAK